MHTFDHPGDDRDHGSNQQEENQRVGELGHELAPFGHGRLGLQLIRPVLLAPALRLGAAQAACRVCLQLRHNVARLQLIRVFKCWMRRRSFSWRHWSVLLSELWRLNLRLHNAQSAEFLYLVKV